MVVYHIQVSALLYQPALIPPLASHLRHESRAPRRGYHVVQRLMGHSNIATTTRYLHLSDADLLAAVDRAFPEG